MHIVVVSRTRTKRPDCHFPLLANSFVDFGDPTSLQSHRGELSIFRLEELIRIRHPLVKLVARIDWSEIEHTFAVSFTSCRGRPALAPWLITGPLCLQHTIDASD